MTETKPKRGRGRPRLAEQVERLTISLPAQVLQLIDEQAQREGMTRPDWVRAALMRALAGRTT